MILNEVLKNLKNVKIEGEENLVIKDIFSNSDLVTKNSLFISISKTKEEKKKEILEAVNKGATAIVIEDKEFVKEIPKDITSILVQNTNIAKAAIACNFFEHPSTKMNVIGVTGTVGKTMTAMLLREVLSTAGNKVGLITNLYNAINDKIVSKEKEFLDAIDLQRLLAEMHKEKIEYVVMEVPEKSIRENKVLGCKFSSLIYTNTNNDKIVLEKGQKIEDYIENQKKIFAWSDLNIVNNDDFFSEEIVELSAKSATYGIANRADYTAIDINCRSTRIDYLVRMEGKTQRIVVNIPGRFMVYNSLAVAALAMQIGISSKHVIKALEKALIPGVFEVVNNNLEIPVIINGSKTVEEIEDTINDLRPYSTGRLTSIIGCDSNTSQKDRKFIGKTLGELSDMTIITTYNPRNEKAEKLSKDVLDGVREANGKGIQIEDRKEAIEFALSKAQRRDLILLFGMGDEKFLEIGNEHIVFDERKVVEAYFKDKKTIDKKMEDATDILKKIFTEDNKK